MKSTYIIGEIGQNHNGSVDIAKLIVDLVSRPVREEVFNLELRPPDAVKMFFLVMFRTHLWRAPRLSGTDGRGAF